MAARVFVQKMRPLSFEKLLRSYDHGGNVFHVPAMFQANEMPDYTRCYQRAESV